MDYAMHLHFMITHPLYMSFQFLLLSNSVNAKKKKKKMVAWPQFLSHVKALHVGTCIRKIYISVAKYLAKIVSL